MAFHQKYDPTDAADILRYAKLLIGKTFYDVLKEDLCESDTGNIVDGYNNNKESSNLLQEAIQEYGNPNRKGGLGNLIEKHHFHYNINSNPEADFSEANLELKVTPYEIRHGKGKHTGETNYVAGERVVLSMINYNQRPIEFDFTKSHVWQKCCKILLIFYLRNKSLATNLNYHIDYVGNFTPSESDRIIIQQDYIAIMNKIAAGRAHEISESDTMYLGACTKGSKAISNFVIQDINGIPAQKRAFCLKNSYMTTVLNEYFINSADEQENIVTDYKLLADKGFEGYIESKISQFTGKTDKEICNILGLEYTKNKSQWINIAFAMLGIKSNKAKEFQKANIVVKATRIEENGKIRENTSFPPFKFLDLVNEVWLDSDEEEEENSKGANLQAYFASTKFLFVVFKKEGENYTLKGSQLWNMPYNDLNTTVKDGWEKVRQTIINGVTFSKRLVKSGGRKGKYDILNNLPGKDANPIIHIRPHAQKAYYKFSGYEEGESRNGNELPNGDWMTTQCFWLNNSYIHNILRDDLKR